MEWDEAWSGLDDAWRRAFELAWGAFLEGSIAVGAVVLGPDGQVMAEGRNRAGGPTPLPGQLVGSTVAHAEVNVLGLVPRGTPGSRTMLSTLEPCFMCTTVARFAGIDRMLFAAADPVWEGADRIGELNAFYARREPTREEVDLGRLSTWAGAVALLTVARWISSETGGSAAEKLADGHVGTTIRDRQPHIAALAGVLLADGLAPGVDLSLEQALARWWPAIEASGTPG